MALADLSTDLIRWIHLSDFHVGKDGYGQSRLFKYILDHVRTRVADGRGPDLVFITGDIANKGQSAQYQEFYENFFLSLLECLPPDSQECIFIVPGNHDVNRMQARAVQTYDVLLRVPEFLDPTEQGQFERQAIFSRFQAYAENDLTCSGEHWLFSSAGILRRTVSVRGQTIGILGVNTAWLSCSDEDRHKLSAGKGLLEDGLESLQGCNLKIVLGHHPLDWFLDTDLEPVRALFGRHTALYLHGHMHKGRSRYDEGGGYPFLILQSGACFQARESDIWVNRFLWCELDPSSREIRVEPLQWSSDQQSWVLDGDAFPERYRRGDRWILALPTPAPVQPGLAVVPPPDTGLLQLPPGWALVDAKYLKDRNVELSNEQALSYFDGRTPIWREALAPQIPRREIVRKLVNDLETARREGGLCVTLLTGAAGEGKTTALLQTVCDLVNNNGTDWHILWRYDPDALMPAEFIARLPQSGTWLVVSDDAEVIARRVFEAVQALKLAGRKNVHFFLCCRDTDWKAAKVENLPWNQYVTFIEEPLRGLSTADAKQVVTAWSAYGKEGLKSLDGLELDEAMSQLLVAAKSEEISRHEGTFFGAVLQVRWGEGLKDHVDNLLRKLEKRSISGGRKLGDAFAYIAAMHAENMQILSKEVLAEVLQVNIGNLKRAVLGPLGEEAAIATTGRLVFTRHRAIADVALQILSEVFDVDLEELYMDLIRSARRAFLAGTYVPDIGKWNYLSSYFFDKGDHALGIRLAQAALEIDPDDPYFIVKLAQLYRDAGLPEQSAKEFRSVTAKVERNERPYYHEWGLCEGHAGRHAVSVWLIASSLSDEVTRRPPDNERGKLSLNALSLAFAELYDQFNVSVFIEACSAAAQLGFRLKLDPKLKAGFIETKVALGRLVSRMFRCRLPWNVSRQALPSHGSREKMNYWNGLRQATRSLFAVWRGCFAFELLLPIHGRRGGRPPAANLKLDVRPSAGQFSA
jgi:tetratricopeptide (TPR) repeat protein